MLDYKNLTNVLHKLVTIIKNAALQKEKLGAPENGTWKGGKANKPLLDIAVPPIMALHTIICAQTF